MIYDSLKSQISIIRDRKILAHIAKFEIRIGIIILCFLNTITYSQSIEFLLKKANANPLEISTFNKILDYQYNLIDRDRDSAKLVFTQIQPFINKLNNDQIKFRVHHEWSRISYLDSDYEKALNHATLAYKLSKKLNNQMFEARAGRLLVIMNHRVSNDTEAMKYAVLAAKLLENSTDTTMLSSTYNSLSSFYSDMGLIEKALDYSLKSIDFAKKVNDIKGMLGGMNNAATSYIFLSKYNKAETLLKDQLKIAIKNNKPRSIERAYTNLCDVYIATDNVKQLNVYFPLFKIFIQEYGDEIMKEDNWSNFYDTEAKYHLYNLRFEEAEKSINKGLEFAEKSTFKMILQNLYVTKSDIYTAWHRFDKATIYFEKSDSLEKSLKEIEMVKYGEELETKYSLTQKQNELLQKDIALQKSKSNIWLMMIVFAFLSAVAGLAFYIFRKNSKLWP